MTAAPLDVGIRKEDERRLKFVELLADVFAASITDYTSICSNATALDHLLRQAAAKSMRGIPTVRLQKMAMVLHEERDALMIRFAQTTHGLWDILKGLTSPALLRINPSSEADLPSDMDDELLQISIGLAYTYECDCGVALQKLKLTLDAHAYTENCSSCRPLTSSLLARQLLEPFEPLLITHCVDPGCMAYLGHLHAPRLARAIPLIGCLLTNEWLHFENVLSTQESQDARPKGHPDKNFRAFDQ